MVWVQNRDLVLKQHHSRMQWACQHLRSNEIQWITFVFNEYFILCLNRDDEPVGLLKTLRRWVPSDGCIGKLYQYKREPEMIEGGKLTFYCTHYVIVHGNLTGQWYLDANYHHWSILYWCNNRTVHIYTTYVQQKNVNVLPMAAWSSASMKTNNSGRFMLNLNICILSIKCSKHIYIFLINILREDYTICTLTGVSKFSSIEKLLFPKSKS